VSGRASSSSCAELAGARPPKAIDFPRVLHLRSAPLFASAHLDVLAHAKARLVILLSLMDSQRRSFLLTHDASRPRTLHLL
jgi:hypothetical protein